MSSEIDRRWSDLMRAANGGDEAAYRTLLGELAPLLRTVAARGLARAGAGNGDAEDVMQEILLAVHMKRHTWDAAQPLMPWLNTIARNKVIDCLRRRGRRGLVDLDEVSHLLPSETAGDPTARRDALRMVGSLKGRQRAVIEAISIDGASIGEAAGRLGISEGAVRVALHRGIAALTALYRKT